MNLLKHYIKRVISVRPVKQVDWMKHSYVEVTLIANCYGNEREYTRWFGEKEWETVQKQGYFMA